MTVTVDLDALQAAAGIRVPLLSERRVRSAVVVAEPVAGFDGIRGAELVADVLAFRGTNTPSVSVLVEMSADGDSWETAHEFEFTTNGTASFSVEAPEDMFRVTCTPGGGLREAVVSVTCVPKFVDEAGGGGNGGSQPGYIGPFTIYALQAQAIDATGDLPDGGTLTVAYGGVDSDPINATDNAAAAQAALEAIPALTGKIVQVGGGLDLIGGGIILIEVDESLAPFELFTLSNNSLTASATPVADPLLYAYGETQTDLFTPGAGDVIEDFVISVPQGEGFGSGSTIRFAPASGDADWSLTGDTSGLLLDSEDGSQNWTVPGNGDLANSHSMFEAQAAQLALDTGNYPTLPCVCVVASEIQALVERSGHGSGGSVKVWVKTSASQAPG